MKIMLLGYLAVAVFVTFGTRGNAQGCKNGQKAHLESLEYCKTTSSKGSCCHGKKCVKGNYIEVSNLFGCEFLGKCFKNGEVLQREKPGSSGVCYKHICKSGVAYYYPLYQYEGCWVRVKGKDKCIEPGRAWKENCIKYRCVFKNGRYQVRKLHSKSKCKGMNGCVVPNSSVRFSVQALGGGQKIENCRCKCTTKRNFKCKDAPRIECVGVPVTRTMP